LTETYPIIPFDALRLDGERILLVGGAGFIGHHLALECRAKGAEVMVMDNLQVNNLVKIVSDVSLDETRRQLYINFVLDRFRLMRDAGIELANVDARAMADFAVLFNEFSPTKVVHLAAISSAVDANKTPGLAYDLQITSLRNVLELCRLSDSKVDRVVFMSSSTVYGDFEGDSVDETVRPQPRGVYANGKYMGERMVREAWTLYELPYTIIRPSALYGIRCVSGRVSQKFVENALLANHYYWKAAAAAVLTLPISTTWCRALSLAWRWKAAAPAPSISPTETPAPLPTLPPSSKSTFPMSFSRNGRRPRKNQSAAH